MTPGRFIYAVFASLCVLLAIAMALELTGQGRLNNPSQRVADSGLPEPIQPEAAQSAGRASPAGQERPSNVLELPSASRDFVGYWGGYTRTTIERIDPDLVGSAADRVSIIFGEAGNSIFAESTLYSPANQRIVGKLSATMIGSKTLLIRYASEDKTLRYVCAHRFELLNADAMTYHATIQVYSEHSSSLLGIVSQRASLKRLVSERDRKRFARPFRKEIPLAEVSAETSLHGR